MKNDKKEEYRLLSDAYYGNGGFSNGGYLEKHVRETNEKYGSRQKVAYYLNYTAPCVNAHVDPIFKREPQREYKGKLSSLWESFAKDTDLAGTDLNTLMKRWAHAAKLYGSGYVVVDNTREEPMTLGEALETNKRPYAYLLKPERIREIRVDNNGKINYFSFLERDPVTKKDLVMEFTKTGWQLMDGSSVKEEGEHGLGRVPVIRLTGREVSPFDMFPTSEFISIAQTNRSIYNKCSWLDDILKNQTFPILTYPADKTPPGLVIGTENALGYPSESRHVPDFISPPDSSASVLENQIVLLQQEIYRMAVVVNVTGVRSESSGVAKQWDFEQTNQLLSSFAENISVAENELAELFSLWLGEPLEYKAVYQKDFSISDTSTELANAETAKQLDFGADFMEQVLRRLITSYLPGLGRAEYEKIISGYRERESAALLDKMQE